MDFLAIASLGTYPTPTPTLTARAAYAVSYGLLGSVYTPIAGLINRGLYRLGLNLRV